ncbi:MAG: hypothetical protein WDO74_33425 [Pseudomonadota bacterium]
MTRSESPEIVFSMVQHPLLFTVLSWLLACGALVACSGPSAVASAPGQAGSGAGGGAASAGTSPGGTSAGGAGSGGASAGTSPAGAGGASAGSAGTNPGGSGGSAPIVCPGDSTDSSGVGQADGSEGAPQLLSQAGLFQADMQTLASGVRPFQPQYQLWADGATKRRWISLPDGTQINTQDMDFWDFPVGTRVFKEFSRNGIRIETRMLLKRPNENWMRVAYQWRADQTEADQVPCGVTDSHGTPHDIPSAKTCGTCHLRMPDKLIGFSALQLAHDSDDPTAWTLARLSAEGRLSQPPTAIPKIPGDEKARAALGYMHANCGHCHSPRSSVTSRISILLWLQTDSLADVASTTSYRTSVAQKTLAEEGPPGVKAIIDPGSPQTSSLFVRIAARGPGYSMPPVATNEIDPVGRQAIEDWIVSLGNQ